MTATSTIAIDDEVGDQRQRVALVRGWKHSEIALRGLRVVVRPGQRVLGATVVDNAPPDLVDLLGIEGWALEETLDARRLGRRRLGQHGYERQRPLSFPQIGSDRLAEAVLVGDEVERVVGDLEGDADVEPVPGERLDLVGRKLPQHAADGAARRDERGGLL